ncbi:MAG: hypothetical protein DRH57_03170, partial [Candidatus Cloacimonadota bacterium]
MFKIKLIVCGMIFFIFALALAEDVSIYPTPDSVKCSKDIPDSIEINWKAPVPPVYGEGFETGKVPPDSLWDIISKNKGVNTWHINDQTEYVHSGSYSAICNWMPSEYTKYVDDDSTAESWHTDSLMIAQKFTVNDTLLLDRFYVLIDKKILNDSLVTPQTNIDAKFAVYSDNNGEPGNKIAGDYVVEIDYSTTKHWEIISTRKEKVFDSHNKTNNLINLDLLFYPQESFFIIADFTESDNIMSFSVGIDESGGSYLNKNPDESWSSNPGNLMIRTDLINNLYAQDEWLISSELSVSTGDLLHFWLGGSPIWGLNAPFYLLVSTDNGVTWTDTLFDYTADPIYVTYK